MIKRHRIFITLMHKKNKAITDFFQITNNTRTTNTKHKTKKQKKKHKQKSIIPGETTVTPRQTRKTRTKGINPFINLDETEPN